MKIDFNNINTESKNILDNGIKQERKKKAVKSNKRIQLYLTENEEKALLNKAEEEHITIKQYILKKTIYA